MASPLFNQFKKVISPRSPLMRLKSPFKSRPTRKPLISQKTNVSNFSNTPKRLFEGEDLNTLTIRVPKIKQVVTLESNENCLLDKGVDEKNVFVLGKGSFGTVILSKLKGETVAVKVVKNNLEHTTMARELNSLILSHPNIVDVIQVVHNAKKPFGVVVMEAWSPLTLQATTVKDAWSSLSISHTSTSEQEINISFEDSIRLLLGIVRALEYCHEVGIVHLDVKPKNILIDLKRMQSKLCDFGNSHNIRSTSSTPHFQGTVAYIAPELLKGQPITEKCDVYSFGITMWQVLHKENPYPGFENHMIIYQVVANHYRPQTSVDIKPDIKGYIKLYEKCWQHDVQERPTMTSIGCSLQSMISR